MSSSSTYVNREYLIKAFLYVCFFSDVVVSSAMKFVEFFAALVMQDFDHALKESEETQHLQQTLLWQLIWVKERLPHANTKVQELIKLILDSACNEVIFQGERL